MVPVPTEPPQSRCAVGLEKGGSSSHDDTDASDCDGISMINDTDWKHFMFAWNPSTIMVSTELLSANEHCACSALYSVSAFWWCFSASSIIAATIS